MSIMPKINERQPERTFTESEVREAINKSWYDADFESDNKIMDAVESYRTELEKKLNLE